MLAQVSTWWTILRISVEERLVYRADFALGTLMRFLPIVTQIFLWGAVFQAANPSGPGEKTVAGYSYPEVIAYYMLTMISRAFSSMPGLASGIARDIRMGTVKKYLIQPIDMLGFLLLYRAAHKAVYYWWRPCRSPSYSICCEITFPVCRAWRRGWRFSPRWRCRSCSAFFSRRRWG